jgi:hypothetical protein
MTISEVLISVVPADVVWEVFEDLRAGAVPTMLGQQSQACLIGIPMVSFSHGDCHRPGGPDRLAQGHP